MATADETVGVINPEELYTLDALKRRLGIRDAMLRTARRSGLRVYYKHGRGFVYGRDWISYVCSPETSSVDGGRSA
ncbi:MAG: hypothetical protein FJ276_30550 [Planctomycetes bacterium]|nr:hypothetical protein [Planctomycetota bacterium]